MGLTTEAMISRTSRRYGIVNLTIKTRLEVKITKLKISRAPCGAGEGMRSRHTAEGSRGTESISFAQS